VYSSPATPARLPKRSGGQSGIAVLWLYMFRRLKENSQSLRRRIMIPICKYLIQQVSSSLLVVIVAGGFVYSQTATVSGGNFGMGTYNFTGTTNVDGTSRQYFDLPSTAYRLEYRNNPSYGLEWEIWESTARGGSGVTRYYNTSNSTTPPASGWQLDVASGPVPTVVYSLTSVDENTQLPEHFTLNQNYPNPFNPNTTITYQLQSVNHVTLKVFDALGKEVATLVNEVQYPGNKSVIFDASALASGIYLYRLQSGFLTQTRKLLLLK
jgi:hypothetical protein